MIVYNMRYRGPLEYDKFVLNTFQFHNEVNGVIVKEFENSNNVKSFKAIQENLNNLTANYIGRELDLDKELSEKTGYSKDLYLFLTQYREV